MTSISFQLMMISSSRPISPMHLDNNGNQLSGAGIDFDVVHTSQPVTVADIDDFFIVHIGDSAKHTHTSLRYSMPAFHRLCL